MKSPFAGGGIAAAAAQAAASRHQKNSGGEAVDASGDAPKSPFAGGGIAAAAAQAARRNTLESGRIDVPSYNPAFEGGPEARRRFYVLRLGPKEPVDSALTSLVSGGTLTRLQEMALLRSLSLSNQAMSVGMAGWLEYGSSELLDRSVDRAFEVMQNLASLHAQQGRWTVTVDILRALVMKCEEHLPLYHPLTLVSMLDLAGSLTEISYHAKAKKISTRILQRLSVYLSEQEEHFFDARHACLRSPQEEPVVFQEHSAADFVIMISEFVKALTRLEKRDVLRLFKEDNGAIMLNHSIIADSLGVLANCTAMNERTDVELMAVHNSTAIWSLAYHHYRHAFEGWSRVGQCLDHPNVSAIVCGLARCLRETGERAKAIKILEAVVSARKARALKTGKTIGRHDGVSPPPDTTVTFLPPRNHGSSLPAGTLSSVDDEQINALCLWSLAIYRVEDNPTERERIHALNLLHLSAESLRRALKQEDLQDNTACLEMLRCVEAEARELFQPVKDADDEVEQKELLELLDSPVHNLTKRLELAARQVQGRFVSA